MRSSRRRTRSPRPSIGRRIGLPRRIVTILEGESLFNDATALVALRTAIAAGAGSVAMWRVGVDFLVASVGGALIGFVAFLLVAKVRKHVTDPVLDTAISFVVPFATFIVSEELHSSGVVSVVVAGLLLGHKAPILQTAQSRIAERMNWRTIAFFLENTVFMLIGLQADWILRDVSHSAVAGSRIALVCGADPRRRDRAAAGVGVRRSLPADPARPRPRPRQGARRRPSPSCSAGPGCAAWSRWPRRSSSRRTPPTARCCC